MSDEKVEPTSVPGALPSATIEIADPSPPIEFEETIQAQVLNWMDRAPLIGEEDRDEFEALIADVITGLSAETLEQQMLAYKFALDEWQEARESEFRAKSYSYHLRLAAEAMFRKTHELAHVKSAFVGMDCQKKASEYVRDKEFREQARALFEKAGFPRDAVEIDARRRSVDDDIRFDRLATSAARRKMTNLKTLEKMRAMQHAKKP